MLGITFGKSVVAVLEDKKQQHMVTLIPSGLLSVDYFTMMKELGAIPKTGTEVQIVEMSFTPENGGDTIKYKRLLHVV